MAKTPAGHFCYLAAETRDDRRQDQGRLVAHAARGVFIHGLCTETRQIDRVARTHHRVGQNRRLMVVHTAEKYRHGERRHLIIGNRTVGKARDDKADFRI